MVIKATKDVIVSKREDSKEMEIYFISQKPSQAEEGPCLVDSEEADAWESFSGNSYQNV